MTSIGVHPLSMSVIPDACFGPFRSSDHRYHRQYCLLNCLCGYNLLVRNRMLAIEEQGLQPYSLARRTICIVRNAKGESWKGRTVSFALIRSPPAPAIRFLKSPSRKRGTGRWTAFHHPSPPSAPAPQSVSPKPSAIFPVSFA